MADRKPDQNVRFSNGLPFENRTIQQPDMFWPFENRTNPVFGWLLYSYFILHRYIRAEAHVFRSTDIMELYSVK